MIQRPWSFPPSAILCSYLIMSGLQKCPGCLKQFASQTAHLSQTSNPLCRRIAKKCRSGNSGSVCVLQKQSPQPLRSQPHAPHHSPLAPISPITATCHKPRHFCHKTKHISYSHDEVPFLTTTNFNTFIIKNSFLIIHDISSNIKISLRNPDI